MMDDSGWGSLLVVIIIWATCVFMSWYDKKCGRDRW